MDRIIKIKHQSGEHLLSVPDEKFESCKDMIIECIKGKMDILTATGDDESIKFFPAELLRNSVIVFEPSEIQKEIQSQKI